MQVSVEWLEYGCFPRAVLFRYMSLLVTATGSLLLLRGLPRVTKVLAMASPPVKGECACVQPSHYTTSLNTTCCTFSGAVLYLRGLTKPSEYSMQHLALHQLMNQNKSLTCGP